MSELIIYLFFYQVLAGQKYGHRSLPYRIPEDDYELIEVLSRHKSRHVPAYLLEVWYKRDMNTIPPTYVLQNMEDVEEKYVVSIFFKTRSRGSISKLSTGRK